MPAKNFEIKPYDASHHQRILELWERSVLATHDFLAPTDFIQIRDLVHTIDFSQLPVYCLAKRKLIAGFICVSGKKVEMLFLDPQYFGLGLGKILMKFAITELGADGLDVNEQNKKAVMFYESLGFETFERTDKDDQGRNYPLLRMKLKR